MTLLLPTLDVIAGLQPEGEQEPEKKMDVVKSPELEEILALYEEILALDAATLFDAFIIDTVGLPQVSKCYSAAAISQASIALVKYEHPVPRFIGMYLSSLINKSEDKEFVIYTTGYTTNIDYVGSLLPADKKLTIIGSVESVGYRSKGIIEVHGRVDWTHDKNEGTIIIHGDCRYAGLRNYGSIFIDGSISRLSYDLGNGNVYHKGVLIVDKGRKLV